MCGVVHSPAPRYGTTNITVAFGLSVGSVVVKVYVPSFRGPPGVKIVSSDSGTRYI